MLVIHQLRHAYADHVVLDGVDLTARAGQVLGLVGANGAGKTTLVSIVAGLLRPLSGSITIDGLDARRQTRLVGLAPQRLGLYPTLTVQDNLVGFARLHGLRAREAAARAHEVAESVGIADLWTRPAGDLSGGQQRLLHTGLAVMHRPRLLFLDEPTVGADVRARAAILDLVRSLAADGAAVVYTTHHLTELEQLDAEIAVLDGGTIIENGPVRSLVSRHGTSTLTLRFSGAVPSLPGWQRTDDALRLTGRFEDAGIRVSAALVALGSAVDGLAEVRIENPSLETAYLTITGHQIRSDDHVAA
jgi:ABC-2 type transport system ATP-binding protein